jgi:hypothetical protein
MSKIFGIFGNRRVGKDTFFSLVKNLDKDAISYAFADELKKDLAPFIKEKFDIDIFTADGPEKELVRDLLIAYGKVRRKQDIDYWVDIVAKQIIFNKIFSLDDKIDSKNQYIKDMRFINEYIYLKNLFGEDFILIGIEREGAVEPTEEEKIHGPEVAKVVDHWIRWPDAKDNFDTLKPYVQEFYDKYIKN